MKIEHYVIVFFLAASVLFLVSAYRIQTLEAMDNRTEEYNRNIDQATDDAMNDMIKVTDSFTKDINLDECADGFFNSLFSSFGLVNSPTGQKELAMYIPVMLVTDIDGFYVMHHSGNSAGSVSAMQWTEKMPYYYSGLIDDPHDPSAAYKFILNYRMGDEVSLALTYRGQTKYYDGKYKYLASLYPGDSMISGFCEAASVSGKIFDPKHFDEIRLSAMAYQVSKKMNFYVNEHNAIARSYGISYNFELPESSTDSFARAIDSISLLVIFQGYPYGVGTDDVYSRFSVSGSRLFKVDRYVIEKAPDGVSYYHRPGCSHIVDSSKTYATKKKCAEHGAYPCQYCNP
jgi:hypothetical protein